MFVFILSHDEGWRFDSLIRLHILVLFCVRRTPARGGDLGRDGGVRVAVAQSSIGVVRIATSGLVSKRLPNRPD